MLPEQHLFSQSSLQDYVDCKRRFQYKYIERLRYPAPEVDDMLEFERRMLQGERFHHLVHQHQVGIPSEALLPRINDNEVRRWFETYLAKGTQGLPQTTYPERTLTIPMGEYGLLAKFDLLAIDDQQAVIIDWKTSRRVPKREWLAEKMQTIVYRYVLAKGGTHLNNGTPIPPENITMMYWYADCDGEAVTFTYDQAQMKHDETFLQQLIADIASQDEFPLTDDERRCKFCQYRGLCNRGVQAGALDDWDIGDADEDLTDFEINLEQIAEIEF